jgi:hypothetical protein
MTWEQISAVKSANSPSARDGHGFTSAGGKLYVHAGWGSGNFSAVFDFPDWLLYGELCLPCLFN